MSSFRAFADGASVLTVGELTIEDRGDRVSIHGSLDISATRMGLEEAKALQAAMASIVDALTARQPLPEKDEGLLKTVTVKNPFA